MRFFGLLLVVFALGACGSFNGKDGKDGSNGVDGKQGIAGIDGQDGIDGIDGLDGKNGDKGEQGEQGERGIQGPQGQQGEQGPAGDTSSIDTLAQKTVTCTGTHQVSETAQYKFLYRVTRLVGDAFHAFASYTYAYTNPNGQTTERVFTANRFFVDMDEAVAQANKLTITSFDFTYVLATNIARAVKNTTASPVSLVLTCDGEFDLLNQ